MTITDYQTDAWVRIINMMTLLYHPIWPVGYFYLAKPFYVLFGHPEWTLRIFSLITGSASAALVYFIVEEISGRKLPALLSALFVAVLPAHVSLSTQSLAEAPFLFFLLAWLLALVKRRLLWSAFFLGMATLIRVESWPLLLIVPLYLAIQSRQGKDWVGRAAFSIRSISLYGAASLFLPVVYIGINKYVGRYRFFWQVPLEDPGALLEGKTVYSLWGTALVTVRLFFQGFANFPSPKHTSIGDMGSFISLMNPLRLSPAWYALFFLVLGLAVLGIIHGLKSRWQNFELLLIAPAALTAVLVVALFAKATGEKPMLTLLAQVFITILAAVGLYNLLSQGLTRRAGQLLTLLITSGFLILALTSRYSAPSAPLQAAAFVRGRLGQASIQNRLVSTIGLAGGPNNQTELILKIAGPYARYLEPFARPTGRPQVILLLGGSEQLDSYLNNSIQAYAGLAFDQFEQVEWPDRAAAFQKKPRLIVLARESLEYIKTGSSAQTQAELSSSNYALVFRNLAFEVWELEEQS